MSALLGEPFLLASYPTPSQKNLQPGEVGHSKRSRYVNATCSSNGYGEGLVTVSVQGDGIHVLELSSMHATVSHTLGPSAFFAAPAVTRFDGSDASTSYAVMQSAPDGIDPKERGRTVWRWRDYQSKRPEEPPEPKLSAVFSQCVEHIWAPSGLPSHVIAVSPSGEIMLSDEVLSLTSSSAIPDANGVLLRSWIFRSEECAFLPNKRDPSRGTVVICFIMVVKRLKLRIALAQSNGDLKDIAECDLGVQENVIDISCDASGYISILTQRGEWRFSRLGHDPGGTVTATSLAGPLRLTGLSLPLPSGSGSGIVNGPSLLSVGSSYVLLAAITGGLSPEIVLLLWDIQYAVVLASQTLALPSTLVYTPKSPPSLELVPASRTQALLVLSPAIFTGTQRNATASQSRSTVLVVPLGVPPVSTIALAMGKARDTEKWHQSTHNLTSGPDQDQNRCQMIQSIRQALEQGRPQAAEATFFIWVKEETARLEHLREKDAHDSEGDEIVKGSDNGTGLKKEHKTSDMKTKWKKTPTKPILSHQFVSTILHMVLQLSKPSDSPYPSKIVLYLVDRRAVGHAMVEGGLFVALRLRRDWESITSALRNVPDIPEADLVKLLADVVILHRQHRDPQHNNMHVDVPADMPPLAQFLGMLVDYATSPPLLRLALKQHLTDARDVVCVFEVLERWVERWCEKKSGLVTSLGDPSVDGSQGPTRPGKEKVRPSKRGGMPSLENVISFIQNVLDTHFLTLLQYSPSHATIERIAQHCQQQLASVDELDRLRGPLEYFVRAESQKARSKQARKEGDGEWRKKRKEASEAAELAVGLYQIEELVI